MRKQNILFILVFLGLAACAAGQSTGAAKQDTAKIVVSATQALLTPDDIAEFKDWGADIMTKRQWEIAVAWLEQRLQQRANLWGAAEQKKKQDQASAKPK